MKSRRLERAKANSSEEKAGHQPATATHPINLTQRTAHSSSPLSPQTVLQLQGSIGNQAVQRLLFGSKKEKKPEVKAPASKNFQKLYDNSLSSLKHLSIDITPRLLQLEEQSKGSTLEDYSAEIFGTPAIIPLLKDIDTNLEAASKTTNEKSEETLPDYGYLKEMIADMLLFSSVVPTKVSHDKLPSLRTATNLLLGRWRYGSRLAAEVMSPNRLVEVLGQIEAQTKQGKSLSDANALKHVDYSNKDTLSKRMLELSLVNMKEKARATLKKDKLFNAIGDSSDIMSIMMASSGPAEQRFLNSCSAASANQDVLSRVSNIAGLLQVGRGVADSVESSVKNQKTSAQKYSQKQVNAARDAFDQIEKEAEKLVKKGNLKKLQALTRRWSRIMEKLAGVIKPSDPNKLPLLTKKFWNDDWLFSAVSAVGMGLDRGDQRIIPVNGDGLMEEVSNIVEMEPLKGGEKELKPILEQASNKKVGLQHFWQSVFEAGGTRLSIQFLLGGHSVYLKAIKQGATPMFALQDPMNNRYQIKSLEEMGSYVEQMKVQVPSHLAEVLEDKGAVGHITKDQTPMYQFKMNLTNHKDETPQATLPINTLVLKKVPIPNNEEEIMITVKLNGNSIMGVVKCDALSS